MEVSFGAANPRSSVTRQAIFYGLLFAVPPGIGVTGFVTYATGGGIVTPTAAAVGGVTAVLIFSLVFAAAVTNPDEDRD